MCAEHTEVKFFPVDVGRDKISPSFMEAKVSFTSESLIPVYKEYSMYAGMCIFYTHIAWATFELGRDPPSQRMSEMYLWTAGDLG